LAITIHHTGLGLKPWGYPSGVKRFTVVLFMHPFASVGAHSMGAGASAALSSLPKSTTLSPETLAALDTLPEAAKKELLETLEKALPSASPAAAAPAAAPAVPPAVEPRTHELPLLGDTFKVTVYLPVRHTPEPENPYDVDQYNVCYVLDEDASIVASAAAENHAKFHELRRLDGRQWYPDLIVVTASKTTGAPLPPEHLAGAVVQYLTGFIGA
jgi:hypothetical protein